MEFRDTIPEQWDTGANATKPQSSKRNKNYVIPRLDREYKKINVEYAEIII